MSLAVSAELSWASSAPLRRAQRASNRAVIRSNACCWRWPTGKTGRPDRKWSSAAWVGKQLIAVLKPNPRGSKETTSYRARTVAGICW